MVVMVPRVMAVKSVMVFDLGDVSLIADTSIIRHCRISTSGISEIFFGGQTGPEP